LTWKLGSPPKKWVLAPMAGVLAKSKSESVSMKKQSVVSALLQTTVPETSNSRESQLSPYKQTSLVLDQVLLRFPGHYVLSAQDGTTEFHVLVPSSVMHKPKEAHILWMKKYYATSPSECEGDGLV
jgi:hypothetical protein